MGVDASRPVASKRLHAGRIEATEAPSAIGYAVSNGDDILKFYSFFSEASITIMATIFPFKKITTSIAAALIFANPFLIVNASAVSALDVAAAEPVLANPVQDDIQADRMVAILDGTNFGITSANAESYKFIDTSTEFAAVSDAELDGERAGFFWLVFFAISLGISIYETHTTVAAGNGYSSANFVDQWLGTLASGFGAAGDMAKIASLLDVASALKTTSMIVKSADMVQKIRRGKATDYDYLSYSMNFANSDLATAYKVIDNYRKVLDVVGRAKYRGHH